MSIFISDETKTGSGSKDEYSVIIQLEDGTQQKFQIPMNLYSKELEPRCREINNLQVRKLKAKAVMKLARKYGIKPSDSRGNDQ